MSFFTPIPYASYETLLMRLLFAWVLKRFAMPRIPAAGQPWPVGIARFVDLTPLAHPAVYRWLRAAAVVALPFYVAGLGMSVVVPYLCLFFVVVGTLANSQGAMNHNRQVLTLVLVVQAVFYVLRGEPAQLDWRLRFAPEVSDDYLAMHWSRQAVIAVYFTAGLTKLLRSGLGWIRDAPDIAVQFIKTSEQEYYSRLDTSHRGRARAVAEWILRRPGQARAVLSLGLLVELLSPLVLAGRAAGLLGGIVLVGFHRILRRYMRLRFVQFEWSVVIFVVDVPFWIVQCAQWATGG